MKYKTKSQAHWLYKLNEAEGNTVALRSIVKAIYKDAYEKAYCEASIASTYAMENSQDESDALTYAMLALGKLTRGVENG